MMLRTDTNKYTGVNTNYRSDFSWDTYFRQVSRLVKMGRTKQRAMWRARNG